MALPDGTSVPREILEKEARDAEALDDRQLELFPADWSPFGPDGYPTLIRNESIDMPHCRSSAPLTHE